MQLPLKWLAKNMYNRKREARKEEKKDIKANTVNWGKLGKRY